MFSCDLSAFLGDNTQGSIGERARESTRRLNHNIHKEYLTRRLWCCCLVIRRLITRERETISVCEFRIMNTFQLVRTRCSKVVCRRRRFFFVFRFLLFEFQIFVFRNDEKFISFVTNSKVFWNKWATTANGFYCKWRTFFFAHSFFSFFANATLLLFICSSGLMWESLWLVVFGQTNCQLLLLLCRWRLRHRIGKTRQMKNALGAARTECRQGTWERCTRNQTKKLFDIAPCARLIDSTKNVFIFDLFFSFALALLLLLHSNQRHWSESTSLWQTSVTFRYRKMFH